MKGMVGVLAVLCAAYFFLIDGVIKSQLERRGAEMLQAPLAIGGVTFHLLPTSLTLRDVQIGNARVPTRNLVQADSVALPLSLRELLAHKLLIDTVDMHGLRFNQPRSVSDSSAPAASATQSAQLREALQRVQQMLNHPLASNTIDPNTSITGALLADQFKPLLTQITTALNALTTTPAVGDWRILVRRANVDGAFDFGANSDINSGALTFAGTIDNVTPQPQLFDTVTHIDLHSSDGEAAALRIAGSLDARKLAQAALRLDLTNFALTQWPLSTDPELKIVIVSAKTDMQAMLSLTGNQFDLNALTRFQTARFDIATGNNEVARAIADVWRRTDAFDIHLQASGALANPIVKLNSSLDVPLASALQQLRPANTFPSTPFSAAP